MKITPSDDPKKVHRLSTLKPGAVFRHKTSRDDEIKWWVVAAQQQNERLTIARHLATGQVRTFSSRDDVHHVGTVKED